MRVFVYRAFNSLRRFVSRRFNYTRAFIGAGDYGYGTATAIGQLQLPPI